MSKAHSLRLFLYRSRGLLFISCVVLVLIGVIFIGSLLGNVAVTQDVNADNIRSSSPRPKRVNSNNNNNNKDPHDRFVPSDEFYHRELSVGVEPLPDFDLATIDPKTGKKEATRCTPGLCDGGCKLCCSRYGWCSDTKEHCEGEFATNCHPEYTAKVKAAKKRLKMREKANWIQLVN